MKQFALPAGSRLLVAAPKIKLSSDATDELRKALSAYKSITEAHLPLVACPPAIPAPLPVLVLFLTDPSTIPHMYTSLQERVTRPDLAELLVWFCNPAWKQVADAIRNVNQKVYTSGA